jgi:hypothetical protein
MVHSRSNEHLALIKRQTVANSASYTIGDVDFVIKNDTSSMLQDPGPIYRAFLEKLGKIDRHSQPEPIRILVHLEMGRLPSTENLTKLFESGQAWSMFQDGNDYLLRHRPPTFERPVWLARINHRFTRATVFINEEFIRKIDSGSKIDNPVHYPLGQILLMYILAPKEGALFHAAGLKLNGKGVIFPGKSGAGKSTLTRQFAAGGNTTLLSDDRIIVRKIGETFKAYGTPWPGDAGVAENKNVPISGIFFINHGTATRIRAIKPQQALERLLPVTSIPWYDREIMPKILDFCEDLALNVPAYELDFKPSAEVVDVLEKHMST